MIKNFILFVMVSVLSLTFSSCSDDEPNLSISPDTLSQTTWNGVEKSFDGDNETSSTSFIVEFTTKSSGTYIFVDEAGKPYGDSPFNYSIDDKIITFSGAIVGNWTIMEATKSTIVLQAYLPSRHVMTLSKQY